MIFVGEYGFSYDQGINTDSRFNPSVKELVNKGPKDFDPVLELILGFADSRFRVDFGMKRQNSFDVTNPAGSGRIDGNSAGSDRVEIGAGLQSLLTAEKNVVSRLKPAVQNGGQHAEQALRPLSYATHPSNSCRTMQ
ncbi:hypothetical protein AVEN_261696-1 [Araneus ventricosus]|uniref:Uncharacterized protein n=1 Tax=Araneus ventricosus TaxID=182803 RepID=A0A4Y2DUM3_ARAVE|nr:hypothetical protein AVEN_261696-1 [Araneus ventricosus]